MYDLSDLIPFVEAARRGSFSAAAAKLQVTPSAVSKSIARLERALDTRLFTRSTRQLQLTAEGQLLFDQVEKAFAEVDEAVETLSDAREQVSGLIRISTLTAFGRHFVLPLLPELQRRYPQLHVELQFDDGRTDLIAGGFDLAIRRGPIREQSWVARRLCILPLILVASPAYLASRGVPRTPDQLAAHECVSIRFPSGRRAKWLFTAGEGPSSDRPAGSALLHQPQGRLVVSEQPADALVDAAVMGLGVTAIAACFVLHHLREGRLRLLLPAYRLERDSEMFVQYPTRRHVPLRVRATAEFLLERMAADERLCLCREELLAYAAA